MYGKDRYFDYEVMSQFGDNSKPRYYDGSMGGFHPFNDDHRASAFALGRWAFGYSQGSIDAKTIIDNLARDPNNNIVETIKVITHSMGGAYGKGFVAALKAYINTLPIEQQKQIKIEQVVDFDPYEGSAMIADGSTPTFQFIHHGLIANEKENGNVQQMKNNTTSTAHTIFSFFCRHKSTAIWNL